MNKITNKDVMEAIGITDREFYYMKKRDPGSIILIKKGLVLELSMNKVVIDEDQRIAQLIMRGREADKLFSAIFLEAMIKPDNKRCE